MKIVLRAKSSFINKFIIDTNINTIIIKMNCKDYYVYKFENEDLSLILSVVSNNESLGKIYNYLKKKNYLNNYHKVESSFAKKNFDKI